MAALSKMADNSRSCQFPSKKRILFSSDTWMQMKCRGLSVGQIAALNPLTAKYEETGKSRIVPNIAALNVKSIAATGLCTWETLQLLRLESTGSSVNSTCKSPHLTSAIPRTEVMNGQSSRD